MNMVAEMLLTEPAPVAVWAVLLVLSAPALVLLSSPAAMRHPRRAVRRWVAVLREHGELRRRRAAEAVQVTRFAAEVRVAADRAASSVPRWQQRWEQTQEELDAAWQAWLDADTRLGAALAAAAWGTPGSVRTCAEYAARERYLHRTVAAAAERGALPVAAVADAVAGRSGWDARLHPAEQDVMIARASAAWLRQRYQRALAAERAAWQDVEQADRASAGLHREAQLAAAEAARLRRFLPDPHRAPIFASSGRVPAPAM